MSAGDVIWILGVEPETRTASRLRLTRQPVVQITLEAGCETHEAFTRAFRASFGCAPTEYRLRRGAAALPRAPSGVRYVAGGAVEAFRSARLRTGGMEIAVRRLDPIRVALMRHVGPYDQVGLETIEEGTCVQMLHVGPYDREAESLALMREFAGKQGLRLVAPHHEIYLSDPRRVPPEKLKTILRVPTRAA